MKKALSQRFLIVPVFYGIFALLSALVRAALLLNSLVAADLSAAALLKTFSAGLVMDLAAASYLSVPIVLYLALAGDGFFRSRTNKVFVYAAALAAACFLVFAAAAEWFFWDEFSARFNFIAVDYLVYTNEVIGNIRESYPLGLILPGVGAAALALVLGLSRTRAWRSWLASRAAAGERFFTAAHALLYPAAFFLLLSEPQVAQFGNNFNSELAKNGIYSFAYEFRHNELDYDQFYPTRPIGGVFARLRGLLREPGAVFAAGGGDSVLRHIPGGAEKRWNVVQITVESLSAGFLSDFGNRDGLTPNLDRLAREGLFFTNFWATGNRTDRGMEAITLSLPPTPGRSIIKRPRNEGLFTAGSLFLSRGYDTRFIYGGYGYFDNMNYFFTHNGFAKTDRSDFSKGETTFGNVWGLCDEDLLDKVIKEGDGAYAAGRPFYYFVMTTSNHRPYTYPGGKIDIPSHTGRTGAVKYTDYAIGAFFKKAAARPWFKNTLFVITADHCANSAGKTEIPVSQYHIPLVIYAPGLVRPGRRDMLMSQIDLTPTVLGLLGWNYDSLFFGRDALKPFFGRGRALLGTYQKLGYLDAGGGLVVLKPRRAVSCYKYDFKSGALAAAACGESAVEDAVAYYEGAEHYFKYRHGQEKD